MRSERAFVLLCVVPLLLLRDMCVIGCPSFMPELDTTEEKPSSAGCLKDLI